MKVENKVCYFKSFKNIGLYSSGILEFIEDVNMGTPKVLKKARGSSYDDVFFIKC